MIGQHVSINYNTHNGHHAKIMSNTVITGNMEIGNHVFISNLVSKVNDNSLGNHGYEEEMRGLQIRDSAMIGCGAKLLPGVVVGERSVVGAEALVTKDVSAGKLAVGVPARIVRDLGIEIANRNPS